MEKEEFRKFYKALHALYPKQIDLEDVKYWWKALQIYDYENVVDGLKAWRKAVKKRAPGIVMMCFLSDSKIQSVVRMSKLVAEAVITGNDIDDPDLMKIVDEYKAPTYIIIARHNDAGELDDQVKVLRSTLKQEHGSDHVFLFYDSIYDKYLSEYGEKAKCQLAKSMFILHITNEIQELLQIDDEGNLTSSEEEYLGDLTRNAAAKKIETIDAFDTFDFCKLYKVIDPQRLDADDPDLIATELMQ